MFLDALAEFDTLGECIALHAEVFLESFSQYQVFFFYPLYTLELGEVVKEKKNFPSK